MFPLIFAALIAGAPIVAPRNAHCPTGCVTGGCWILVLRYVVNVADPEQPPQYVTKETFTGEDYPSEEAAYCAAERIRRRGIKLPTLERFGRDSNVMPESITPMPAL